MYIPIPSVGYGKQSKQCAIKYTHTCTWYVHGHYRIKQCHVYMNGQHDNVMSSTRSSTESHIVYLAICNVWAPHMAGVSKLELVYNLHVMRCLQHICDQQEKYPRNAPWVSDLYPSFARNIGIQPLARALRSYCSSQPHKPTYTANITHSYNS